MLFELRNTVPPVEFARRNSPSFEFTLTPPCTSFCTRTPWMSSACNTTSARRNPLAIAVMLCCAPALAKRLSLSTLHPSASSTHALDVERVQHHGGAAELVGHRGDALLRAGVAEALVAVALPHFAVEHEPILLGPLL